MLGYPRTDPLSSTSVCSSVPTPDPTPSPDPSYDTAVKPLFKYVNNNSLRTTALLNYDLALGYDFIPQKNGLITKLGAKVAGSNIVRLFNESTGELLAEKTINANGQWKYTSITPAQVASGTKYTVAVYLAKKEGTQIFEGFSFPMTVGDIKITNGKGGFTGQRADIRPDTVINRLYGIPDIEFKAEAN